MTLHIVAKIEGFALGAKSHADQEHYFFRKTVLALSINMAWACL